MNLSAVGLGGSQPQLLGKGGNAFADNRAKRLRGFTTLLPISTLAPRQHLGRNSLYRRIAPAMRQGLRMFVGLGEGLDKPPTP